MRKMRSRVRRRAGSGRLAPRLWWTASARVADPPCRLSGWSARSETGSRSTPRATLAPGTAECRDQPVYACSTVTQGTPRNVRCRPGCGRSHAGALRPTITLAENPDGRADGADSMDEPISPDEGAEMTALAQEPDTSSLL